MGLTGLFKAIKYFGSQNALASVLDVTQQAVSLWLNRNEKIPDLFALKIFVLTKGFIPLEELVAEPKEIHYLLDNAPLFRKYPAISVSIDAIKTEHSQCFLHKNPENCNPTFYDADLSLPILIDLHDQLITCYCRIHANKLLQNKTVYVHRISWTEVLTGNLSITPLLEALPISEKVAVGIALEHSIGNRQGKRKNLQLPDNYPEVNYNPETREIAANIAGFNSEFSYRQAKFIVKNAIPAVIKAMDNSLFTVSKAKKIAELPEDKQQAFVTAIKLKHQTPSNHFKLHRRKP